MGPGDCWEVLAPSPIQDSDGCQGEGAPVQGSWWQSQELQESCTAWLGGRDGDAARRLRDDTGHAGSRSGSFIAD